MNKWTVKDNDGDETTIHVTTQKVAVSQNNSGEYETAMYYNLERLDYLIASLKEARELFKNVRRINR